jgi:ABC-type Fe3+/spermidine/putrescine transport system ATPase subunit
MHNRLGLTTLFVTHDQEEALSLSDRVVLINDGRVEQEGGPQDIYANPKTEFASNFLGSANIIPATIEAGEGGPVAVLSDGQRLALGSDVKERGKVRLVLRQEDIDLGGEGGLQAEVRTRVFLGARNRYVVRLAGEVVRILAGNDRIFAAGDRVGLSVDPQRIGIIG